MHLLDDDLVLHYYGELTAAEQSRHVRASRSRAATAMTPTAGSSRC